MKLMRLVLSVALVAIVATSAFAFMASNFVPVSMAGEGQGAVVGYHVSNISYNISPTDPSMVDGVTFTLDAPAKTVFARYEPPAGLGLPVVQTCTNTSANDWKCGFSLTNWVKLEDINELEVMAAQ